MKYTVSIISLLTVFFLSNNMLLAQTQADSLLVQWAEFIEDESNLGEILQELAEYPVNINSDNRNELQRIPLIGKNQVDSILKIRSSKGKFTNKRQVRPILGPELYEYVKNFISIRAESRHSLTYIHKTYYGIEPVKQIESGKYKGDAFYDYNKLQFKWMNNFRTGMVTQKDIGEENYLDYANGYMEYNHKKYKFIFGSYYCHFGEGLLLSNAYGQRKSSAASLPFRPNNQGGFATLSSSENTGLFGVFMQTDHVFDSHFYLFYSRTNRDAQLNRDQIYITGIDYDGYHRSESEITKKDRVTESIFGVVWQRNICSNLNVGLQYSDIHYDPKLEFNRHTVGVNSLRRQYFKFTGSQINQYSIFHQFISNHIRIQGEIAISQKDDPAITQSIFFEQDNMNFGIKYWRFSKNFQSPFGRAFDNSNPFPQAEQGFYFGLVLNPCERCTINAFKIFKKDLWRTYFEPMPKEKEEVFVELNYQPQNILFLARLRIRDNVYFLEPETENSTIRNPEKQNIYRIQLEYKPAKQLKFRTRWEYTSLNVCEEHGSYLFEDIFLYPYSKFSLRTRLLFYRTDSYNSRLYEYESDLPGSYANYAVYGEGKIYYFILKWNIHKNISLWFKYRYNCIEKRDLTPSILRTDDNELHRSLRFQIKVNI